MTEDELLYGIAEALTFAGWRWQHSRRSDRAVVMGDPGLPDIVAVHLGRAEGLAWELKSSEGRTTPDQAAWLAGLGQLRAIDTRIIRPTDYDDALRAILRPIVER